MCSNLPPGCTMADIDRHFGGDMPEPECEKYSCRNAHREKKAIHHFVIEYTCTGEVMRCHCGWVGSEDNCRRDGEGDDHCPRCNSIKVALGPCGHTYKVAATVDTEGAHLVWKPVGNIACLVCGNADNDFDNEEDVFCADCHAPAPQYCLTCQSWGCVCDDSDPREDEY